MARLLCLIEITRPINCMITFLSVLLGGWLGTLKLTNDLILAGVSASLITGGGNVLNDLCGLPEDRINKPQRPLPSNRLSKNTAIILTILLLVLGLSFAYSLPTPSFFIATLAVIGLLTYNLYLKRVPLLGNLVVSALGGLAFLFGGYAVHAPLPARWPALFAALFHLGREILKDYEDVLGDQALKGSTIPLAWGPQTTKLLITSVFSTLILITPLPAIIDIYGNIYFALVFALNMLLIYVLVQLIKNQERQVLAHLNHLLKAGMLLGLAAFFFDRLSP